jgi:predicted ABC-type transport system involved in lysophospholipase L1 biosynthesis ATPase subunit
VLLGLGTAAAIGIGGALFFALKPQHQTTGTGKLVLRAIARANREVGSTTVVITHNTAIGGMADRVLRMGGGRIVSIEINPHRVDPEVLAW